MGIKRFLTKKIAKKLYIASLLSIFQKALEENLDLASFVKQMTSLY